jgi:hypothetical protein
VIYVGFLQDDYDNSPSTPSLISNQNASDESSSPSINSPSVINPHVLYLDESEEVWAFLFLFLASIILIYTISYLSFLFTTECG